MKSPASREQRSSEYGFLIQWVMKISGGRIQNEIQANYVLVGFAALVIIVGVIFLFSTGGNKAKFEAPPGQKIIYPQNGPPRLQ